MLLWVGFHAVGYSPPIGGLILGYQIGYLSTLLPIPGGIGVLDGGLIAALALYGIPAGFAAPAVLLYHAAWLAVPTILGSIAFVLVRRNLARAVDAARGRSTARDPTRADLMTGRLPGQRSCA